MLMLRPLWLLALLPLALLLWALWRRSRSDASIWNRLVDPHLLPHLLVGETGSPRRWPLILLGVGWLLLVLALAGPVWERLPQPVFATTSQRVILLDLSPSLNAADLKPSRLARARFEILDLLRVSTEGQVALLAFSPEPFVVSPLTGDAKTIADQVPQLTTDLIPVPGPRRTDLALRFAGDLLERAGARNGELILVTDDAGNLAGALEMARALQSAGHRLSVLAVGTAKGAPVPAAGGGFVQDATGAIQIARLDPEPLRELARAGGGRYLEAEIGDGDTRILTAGGALGERIDQTELVADQWREEGPWLLLILLPLAALAFRRGWLVPVVALILVLPPTPGQAVGWSDLWQRPDQQAARDFAAGDTQAAAERFQDPAWQAAARYRSGDFQGALDALSGLQGAETDYNRGNALARLGRLDEAVKAYEQALQQDPNQADARHNLDLVRKTLEQKRPPESQPDPSQQDDPQKQGEGTDQSQKDQEPGEQDSQDGADDQADGQGQGQSSSSETQAKADQNDQASEPDTGTADQQPAPSDHDGSSPDASDFGRDALKPEQTPDAPLDASGTAAASQNDQPSDDQPDRPGVAQSSLTPQEREQQEAMEAQLRRVPDDPAGLLRQRFLLQHLRREGRLP
ncbi:Ca-activated chloride channel family protein [Thiobaca trueperi]|uniref:Ca-activated chloride channel family protein n=2 Tax=Thiobaca trueperi TaxID=127458 RepID=A0A4V2V121_9GAMM|nr:Ca-activated chloride channel family protein [Thiobaca trueperi]